MTSRIETALQTARLLLHKLRGPLTPLEEAQWERLSGSSLAHEALFQKLSDPQYLKQKLALESGLDPQAAFAAFWQKVRKPKRRFGVLYSCMAAALLVLVVGLYWFWPEGQEAALPEPFAKAQNILPGTSQAVLTLSNGDQIALNKDTDTFLQLQDGTAAQASETALIYHGAADTEAAPGQPLVYNLLSVPQKGEFTLVLADGTRVHLNAESSLEYPTAFAATERRVRLTGEAYFEVAPQASAPFVIESGEVEVEVLGTSFNLRAYADERTVQTTLVEGRLRMSARDQMVELAPHEQGSVDFATGVLEKRRVDVQTYVGWTQGRFVFEKQRLEEIMKTLSRWYGVDVVFQGPRARDLVFTGNLQRYDHFGQILHMLSLACPARFDVEETTILITE